jgi:hypothetical protein
MSTLGSYHLTSIAFLVFPNAVQWVGEPPLQTEEKWPEYSQVDIALSLSPVISVDSLRLKRFYFTYERQKARKMLCAKMRTSPHLCSVKYGTNLVFHISNWFKA